MLTQSSPTWLSYVVAILAVAMATVVSAPLANNTAGLIAIHFAAVTLAAWYGGFGPALAATALSYFAVNRFFVSPQDAFTLNTTALVYIFVCLAIGAFSEVSRRALQCAKANAEQVQLIVESIMDGFVVVDDQWRLTYMNRAAAEFNRRHGHAAELQSPGEIFPLTLGAAAQAKLTQAAAERVRLEFEHFYEPWLRWFEIKASPTETGGLAIYFRDITERKLAEEEFRKLASIIESSEDAVIGMDLVGTITSWNRATEKLYGYTREEVLGRSIRIVIPPDHAHEESEILSKVRRGEAIHHYDTVRMAKDGRRIDVSLTVSPIKDVGGRIVGLSKIARDITERKRTEEGRREADRRKDEFLALLGHELRNPLAGIVSGVEVLNQLDTPDPAVAEVRGIIGRQAGHMTRLIDDLLDVSRIVRGKIVLRSERLDLAELTRQTVEDHRALVEQSGLALGVDVGPVPLWVEGDSARLAQVLGNLINNAMKFTDRGGHVDVRARVDENGDDAVIEVSDTGIGMTPETVASLFAPFAQAEETLARSRGGLGLGLAVVKGLVELHHGAVTAESRGPSHGSTFTLRLPLCRAPAQWPAEAPNGTSRVDHFRVLIIDDNPDVANPMSRLLQVYGHDVAVAGDGPSGIEKARRFSPNVVLCDIGLPGDMNGYGVARALRCDRALRSTYLVAVTGFGQEEDRRLATEAGFDRHLTKPVVYVDLVDVLMEAAHGRSRTLQ